MKALILGIIVSLSLTGCLHRNGGSKAPCVTGYCGPVQVSGYYRANGTYVRPYTRRR